MLTESQEQIKIIQWCKKNMEDHPELKLIFAIPNGGHRHIATASRLKLEGVKSGVPDLFLPVARKNFYGLFIELKKEKGGSLSKTQKEWFKLLEEQKYAVVKAHGANKAISILKSYLNI